MVISPNSPPAVTTRSEARTWERRVHEFLGFVSASAKNNDCDTPAGTPHTTRRFGTSTRFPIVGLRTHFMPPLRIQRPGDCTVSVLAGSPAVLPEIADLRGGRHPALKHDEFGPAANKPSEGTGTNVSFTRDRRKHVVCTPQVQPNGMQLMWEIIFTAAARAGLQATGTGHPSETFGSPCFA